MRKRVKQILGGVAVFGILVLLGAAGMGIAHKALERQTEKLTKATVTVADPAGNKLLQTAKNPGETGSGSAMGTENVPEQKKTGESGSASTVNAETAGGNGKTAESSGAAGLVVSEDAGTIAMDGNSENVVDSDGTGDTETDRISDAVPSDGADGAKIRLAKRFPALTDLSLAGLRLLGGSVETREPSKGELSRESAEDIARTIIWQMGSLCGEQVEENDGAAALRDSDLPITMSFRANEAAAVWTADYTWSGGYMKLYLDADTGLPVRVYVNCGTPGNMSDTGEAICALARKKAAGSRYPLLGQALNPMYETLLGETPGEKRLVYAPDEEDLDRGRTAYIWSFPGEDYAMILIQESESLMFQGKPRHHVDLVLVNMEDVTRIADQMIRAYWTVQ